MSADDVTGNHLNCKRMWIRGGFKWVCLIERNSKNCLCISVPRQYGELATFISEHGAGCNNLGLALGKVLTFSMPGVAPLWNLRVAPCNQSA